jgi:hypothetical protein
MRAITLAVLAVLPGSVSADMIAPNPTPLRLALAPVALVGKVTSIEEKPLLATRFVGDDQKVPFVVAVVKIEKGFIGVDGKTHVRVAFPQPVPLPPPQPGLPQVSSPRRPGPKLEKDQEVLLFLRPHEEETVLVAADPFGFLVAAGNPNFKTEVADVEKTAKLLANPVAALKGSDKEARYLVASLLIHKYGQRLPGKSKREPIDAEESKQILTALAEANWDVNQPMRYFQLAPLQTFFRLGLTDKDGWKPPKDFKDFPVAARKWLTEHASTHRLERSVLDK